MHKWYILLIILIITLFSCQAPVQIDDSEISEDTVTLKSISEGAFVRVGETIPVSLEYDSAVAQPSQLEVSLETISGEELGNQTYALTDSVSGEALPEIDLPQLDEGEYQLVYTVVGPDETVLSRKTVPFFYVNDEYKINSISSFPASIQPGSTALLLADYTAPESGDPFIVWKLNDSILKKAFISDGGARLQWIAPQVEGVYTIRAELFPVQPADGSLMNSTVGVDTEIYVTENPKLGADELQPEEQYYSLFHFRGNYFDSGSRESPAEAVQIGNPKLDVDSGVFGYRCDGHSGFRIPELLLPQKDWKVQPFSVVMELVLSGDQKDRILFTTESGSGSFLFRIGLNDAGNLYAELKNGSSVFTSVPGFSQLQESEKYKIILSILPKNGSLWFLWYINDELADSQICPFQFTSGDISGSGSAEIAGENGFSGIIGEFGVFYQDENENAAVLEDIYEKAMQAEFGNDYRFAEGFDDTVLPDAITYSGKVSLQGGSLTLEPGAQIQLPAQFIHNEKLIFTAVFKEPVTEKGVLISFLPDNSEVSPFSIDCTGIFNRDEVQKDFSAFLEDPADLEFSLLQSEGRVEFVFGGQNQKISNGEVDTATFGISILNTSSLPVSIDKIRIISNALQVVQKEGNAEKTVAVGSDTGKTSRKDPNIL